MANKSKIIKIFANIQFPMQYTWFQIPSYKPQKYQGIKLGQRCCSTTLDIERVNDNFKFNRLCKIYLDILITVQHDTFPLTFTV